MIFHCIFCPESRYENYDVKLVFFDVGQGDAALIICPDGCILIDAGPETAEDELIYALKELGITKISFFFLSHADSDHSGGADRVIREFDVDKVYLPDIAAKLDTVKAAASDSDCDLVECSAGDYFMTGTVCIDILSPFVPLSGDENSDSLVIRISYGNTSALFMGDADTAAEERILKQYSSALLACNLIKLGHHGANTSSMESFLSALSPEYAVISCGRGNDYGHPHAKVLTVLKNLGIKAFRTDLSGNLCFVSDGTSLIPVP